MYNTHESKGSPSPLLDLFRRGEVPREVRLLAAQGAVAPKVHDQLVLLVFLAADRDREVADAAVRTLDLLPQEPLRSFLSKPDASPEVRSYFTTKGMTLDPPVRGTDGPSLQELEQELEALLSPLPPADSPDDADGPDRRPISTLSILERVKLAMRGTREQRAVLIRDANKIVAASVLSSPKLTESEVEAFARMGNVAEDVLRIIGSNRSWTKSYGVASALARNPKTPQPISLVLVSRLNERDLKNIAVDRNAPEGLRIAARKHLAANESRRH